MMTEYEARKLRQAMYQELKGTPATLWKCAMGLAIVVLVALLGSIAALDRSSGDVAREGVQTQERRL